MEWDYCDPKRGPSMEKECFYKNLAKLVANVEPFWYDAYIDNIPKLQELLVEKARAYNPDLMFFIPYKNQFSAETLDLLKNKWPTCAWFGDDTWRFESYSSKLAPYFTHVCTTDIFSVEKYKKIGVEPILTQWAAQPLAAPSSFAKVSEGRGPAKLLLSEADPAAPLPPGGEYRYAVSFVGAKNSVRSWFVRVLGDSGIPVECFGHGWPNGKVSQNEMNKIFRGSRINLNLSNSATPDLRYLVSSPRNFVSYIIANKTSGQIKARNFEIPLAGGFQLTNYVAGLERYFKIGEEVAVFATPEECAAQIRYYLANEGERITIAMAGNARAGREHTYLSRFEKILSTIWPQKN